MEYNALIGPYFMECSMSPNDSDKPMFLPRKAAVEAQEKLADLRRSVVELLELSRQEPEAMDEVALVYREIAVAEATLLTLKRTLH